MRIILYQILIKRYFKNSTLIHFCRNKALKETNTTALRDEIHSAYLPIKQDGLVILFIASYKAVELVKVVGFYSKSTTTCKVGRCACVRVGEVEI